MEQPLPHEQCEDGHIMYLSRNNYGRLKESAGVVQITDFGLAVPGDETSPMDCSQAEVYRALEVILGAGYTGEDKVMFIDFIERMVRWRPEERSSTKELLSDPWLHADLPLE
ncbi:hypothetical protein ACRE_062420 [Hapsidospora chrysogenum ATCC 11550]|uniref:Protein kinase domain-containing protein n=1 Tax=Hapsidospora chrysogenum (strain ATCC 11550 / CBS 779.69 / DSM 880 / IAM 14645 / JCM 23072 / IMI 49137) TaxID=857340 RepID=A0A086T0Y6_HAPC1|nr:hypothetical protein ACRE_062420 [Hapsidospora chrysogenum ATCC 11550]